jgi:hypothetical protein
MYQNIKEVISMYERKCGRTTRRQDMTKKQLQAAIKWCKMEIVKLQKELKKKTSETI